MTSRRQRSRRQDQAGQDQRGLPEPDGQVAAERVGADVPGQECGHENGGPYQGIGGPSSKEVSGQERQRDDDDHRTAATFWAVSAQLSLNT